MQYFTDDKFSHKWITDFKFYKIAQVNAFSLWQAEFWSMELILLPISFYYYQSLSENAMGQ
jgi:hypothetical protein